jgi:hypothetical protein
VDRPFPDTRPSWVSRLRQWVVPRAAVWKGVYSGQPPLFAVRPAAAHNHRRRLQSGARLGSVVTEAAEQADAADEGRLEPGGNIMVGKVIADEGKVVRPSQLIRSVRRTSRWSARWDRIRATSPT